MIFLHEIHEVVGGKMGDFEDSLRATWKPLVESQGDARLIWFWHHTHGTGPSYQAISVTAIADWQAWGRLVDRWRGGDLGSWACDVASVRREVTSKILLPTAWSPLRDVDLGGAGEESSGEPAVYLHDTGWPFPGKLDTYVAALGDVYFPQVKQSRMISVEACWTTAPGAGRHHEVVLLQKILDWSRFSDLLTKGEKPSTPGEWMREGLKHRDRWESKLLRTASWSPRA